MLSHQSIRTFSTQTVPLSERFDYWMCALRQSMWPVSEWRVDAKTFGVEMREASLGSLTSITQTINAHVSRRTKEDLKHTDSSCYLVVANVDGRPLNISHREFNGALAWGECVLIDSRYEFATKLPNGFKATIVKLPMNWLHSWLPDPDVLVGRAISAQSGWNQAFSSMLRCLTPELAASPPLPTSVLVDQIGVTLTLIADKAEKHEESRLLNRARDLIRQRCAEPQITATDIAGFLDIPPSTLHGVLARNNFTFASELRNARVDRALEMLKAPSFRQLTIPEIASRSGFLSLPYFNQSIRNRTGHVPKELRPPLH